MNRQKIVVMTGAGISAESGISTFRDSDGLWCNYKVEDICTPEALRNNRATVIDFYNQRRLQLNDVKPNKAHLDLVKLEEKYDVSIITQNVDDLHERAGSKSILHLHGELKKVNCMNHEHHIFDISGAQGVNDRCLKCNGLLRPYIVFFGEAVPNIEPAIKITEQADIVIVIGTSLQVYPAASLLYYSKNNCKKYLVDPKAEPSHNIDNLTIIKEKATIGVNMVVEELLK